MKSIKTVLLASLAILLYACSSQNVVENAQKDKEQSNLSFSSLVEDEATTRKAGNTWENKDAIGIFAFESGKPNSQTTVDPLLNNKKFVTNGDGLFSVEAGETPIAYPTSSRDFIAYYPYSANQAISQDLTYIVDLSDQNSIDEIDLLYSNNLKGFTSSTKPELRFKHALSKFNIKVTSKEFDLSKAKIELTNFNTKADFNLVSQALLVDETVVSEVNLPYNLVNGQLVATALVLPSNKAQNFTVRITLSDGKVVRWSNHKEKGWKWEAGKTYTQTISIGKDDGGEPVDPVDPDPEPGQKYGFMETPQGNETANTMFVVHNVPAGGPASLLKDAKGNPQRNYTMLYDKKYKIAHWVAFPHHRNYMGSAGRSNWGYDPIVPRGDQAALNFGAKPYSRGHQIASSDRTGNSVLNKTTFYYTNMTPQIQDRFNGDIWAKLEKYVQGIVPANDTLWVVTGAGLPKNDAEIKYFTGPEGKMAIPTYYYKALAKKVNGKYYTIGFRFDHRDHMKGENYNDFRVTVKSLEQETGFTFFQSIPAEDKDKIVSGQW